MEGIKTMTIDQIKDLRIKNLRSENLRKDKEILKLKRQIEILTNQLEGKKEKKVRTPIDESVHREFKLEVKKRLREASLCL